MSLHKLPVLLRLILFWMLLFTAGRMILLAVMYGMPGTGDLSGCGKSFLVGLRPDLSASAYLTAIPALLYLLACATAGKRWIRVFNIVNLLQVFLLVLIIMANAAIYKSWGTLLNTRAMSFLRDPEGIIASLSTLQLIIIPMVIALAYLMLIKTYRRWVAAEVPEERKKQGIYSLLCMACIPLMMRGGFQEIPINESAAYFSEKMPLNQLAANPAWNLSNSIHKSGLRQENPYRFMADDKAAALADRFICRETDTLRLLNSPQPNIVLIVLESWSADIIGALSNDSLTTPFFNDLCREGYLFSRIYSSGRRTDQMLPSILSGFPAQPQHSLARFDDKIARLPMLPRILAATGYDPSFIYGGELGFANMHSFLTHAGFKNITGKDDFRAAQMNSKWGAHDEYIFQKAIERAEQSRAPFFEMILTLSTHEPFEVPGAETAKGSSEQQQFRRAAHYTDQCLKTFFRMASQQPWYENTLFVLVADHGHHLPGGRNYYDPAGYHIPLLFTGPALRNDCKGKVNTGIGGQHEIANTLLQQCGLKDDAFPFGSSLIRNWPSATAYLNFDEGFGIVGNEKKFVYLFGEREYIKSFTTADINRDTAFVRTGQAFLQRMFGKFISL